MPYWLMRAHAARFRQRFPRPIAGGLTDPRALCHGGYIERAPGMRRAPHRGELPPGPDRSPA
jgi:hypothetical protein